jgi:hypothetical protein
VIAVLPCSNLQDEQPHRDDRRQQAVAPRVAELAAQLLDQRREARVVDPIRADARQHPFDTRDSHPWPPVGW